jgi:hypothetical protein
MTYSDKLRNPKWQRKRLEIFNRDNFCCVRCNDDKENLQVHHKKYFKNKDPWNYDNKHLETLCETCHFIATYYDRNPFLIIKTAWGTKQTKIVLAYCQLNTDIITYVLSINFKRKSIRESSELPINLKLLNKRRYEEKGR